MAESVLAIDAGTTSIRALLVDTDLSVLSRAVARAEVHHPAPGRVEQDAAQLWIAVENVVERALAAAGVTRRDVAAIGIATQRGNVVVWDRESGLPVAPLVSWQDLRGSARAAELIVQGHLVSHQTSAAKLEAVLAEIDRGRERLNSGALMWGNLDTYLAWRLSGGSVYATEHGQACATGYYDYFAGVWNTVLIESQGLDPARFPALRDTASLYGHSSRSVFGAACPIGALVADQQSATIAEGCLSPGQGKVTFGTSATLDVNTGTEMKIAPGTYPMVLWKRDDVRSFCIEGMVNTAGAMIDWAIEALGLAASADELSRLASTVPDTAGAYVLPALQGLGTPYSDTARRASIGGLTRATTRAHVARAVLEGIAYRLREVRDAIRQVPDLRLVDPLRADGGASRSDALMQIQADAIGAPIERLAIPDATALGAAICAGIGTGALDAGRIESTRRIDRTFVSTRSDDEAEGRYVEWRRHCGLGDRRR
jgi:glycerol kinase